MKRSIAAIRLNNWVNSHGPIDCTNELNPAYELLDFLKKEKIMIPPLYKTKCDVCHQAEHILEKNEWEPEDAT